MGAGINSCILSWGVNLKHIGHCMVMIRMALSLCSVYRVFLTLHTEIPSAGIATPDHRLSAPVKSVFRL